MVKCPICLKSVSRFKTNSHVMPRWIMRIIKTGQNGRYHKLEQDRVSTKQSDDMGEFVCRECEDRFTEDDTFSASFFRDSRFLIARDNEVESHSAEGKKGIFRFLISLCLRAHLFHEAKGTRGFLNDLFEPLRAIYFHRAINETSFIAITKHFTYLANKVSLPILVEEKGYKHLVIHIFGYHFQLVLAVPQNEQLFWEQLRTKELYIIVDNSEENLIISELRELYKIPKT